MDEMKFTNEHSNIEKYLKYFTNGKREEQLTLHIVTHLEIQIIYHEINHHIWYDPKGGIYGVKYI
jgi:hypothetical protein